MLLKERWKIKLLRGIEGEIPGGAGDGRTAEYDQHKSSAYTKFSKSNVTIKKINKLILKIENKRVENSRI